MPVRTNGLPAFTLGRFSPLWIRWIMTFRSNDSPVSLSECWGWWQRTQSLTLRRWPPCRASGLWQLLQAVSVLIAFQTGVAGPPSGLKSLNTLSAK